MFQGSHPVYQKVYSGCLLTYSDILAWILFTYVPCLFLYFIFPF